MIRTQLYLPEELRLELRLLAQQLNVPVAEVVRKALIKGIPQVKKKKARGLDVIVGMIKFDKAPKNLSENLDRYLFGERCKVFLLMPMP